MQFAVGRSQELYESKDLVELYVAAGQTSGRQVSNQPYQPACKSDESSYLYGHLKVFVD